VATLLEIENLKTQFFTSAGTVRAVDGITYTVDEGETVALVGESGCGKSTLGHSILRLEDEARGEVVFAGSDLMALGNRELREKRRLVQIIFQDPFSSLNPRLLVEEIVGEGLRIHEPGLDEPAFRARILGVLDEVGLSPSTAGRYAHEFSGGQRQRIALARALILRPRFMVLDEATRALDVSVQAQILNLLRELQARHGLTYLFITHDLGVVEYLAHEVAVMYLGRIVEYGKTAAVFRKPGHPYTRSLLESVPDLARRRQAPPALIGEVPSSIDPPTGCHFHPRCPFATERCRSEAPLLKEIAPGRFSACHLNDGA